MPGGVTGGAVKVMVTAALAGATLFGPAAHAHAEAHADAHAHADSGAVLVHLAVSPDDALAAGPYARPANGNTDIAHSTQPNIAVPFH